SCARSSVAVRCSRYFPLVSPEQKKPRNWVSPFRRRKFDQAGRSLRNSRVCSIPGWFVSPSTVHLPWQMLGKRMSAPLMGISAERLSFRSSIRNDVVVRRALSRWTFQSNPRGNNNCRIEMILVRVVSQHCEEAIQFLDVGDAIEAGLRRLLLTYSDNPRRWCFAASMKARTFG